jgi:hypothetical protein
VRVEDAGRMPHRLACLEVKPGVVVVESATAWAPCF